MADSLELLESIGYVEEDFQFTEGERAASSDLYKLSETNKISALYTSRLKQTGNLDGLGSQHESTTSYLRKFKRTGRKVVDTLQEEGIEFWVVKTPFDFPADFGDLDILVRDSTLDRAVNAMNNAGFEEFSSDPMGAQYQDPETGRLIDIQRDFALRKMVYLPGSLIQRNDEQTELFQATVKIPQPAPQICLLSIHSVTEQLFLLRDFYHILSLFQCMDSEGYQRLVNIVKDHGLAGTMREVLPIVEELSLEAFGRSPAKLTKARKRWDSEREIERLRNNQWKTPHRYAGRTFATALGSKLHDPTFRRSLLSEATELKSPKRVAENVRQLVKRQRKDTY